MGAISKLASITALTLLSGCFWRTDTVPVDLDFAYTNYGYINSGDFKAGSFLLWNTKQGRMVHLSDIPGFPAPHHPRDKQYEIADYSGGADLGLGVKQAALQARADALIKQNSQFRITYPNVVAYDNVITHITNYLSQDLQDSGTLMKEWSFSTAVKDPDLYYVIIRKVAYGDQIQLMVDDEVKASGSFTVVLRGADLNIQLKGKGLNEIVGTNTEVAFDVYVLRPVWTAKDGGQFPDFEVEHWVDVSDLPNAFRRTTRRIEPGDPIGNTRRSARRGGAEPT